ncbi:MAG: cobalamin transport system substrate-binding protein [Actinomycetota bacterium]|nr:cobalamin transport system substrate-binding protein [Actinomycetota bacterium]MEA2590460.1 cobalamin transport system substrate-binding protein [Actinomycetota bacterium]
MRARVWSFAVLAAVVPAAALGGCSSSKAVKATSSPSPVASATFPATIQATNGPVTLPARPSRIVSLSASLTEDLFAIGAGPQVVAVDDQSNYPTGVPKTSLSGFTPNVEAIAGYRPDLVVVSDDVKGLVGQLKALSIPTLLDPAPSNLDGSYAEITQLGAASGHTSEAAGLVQTMKGKVTGLLAKLPKRAKPLTYYYELDQTLFTVTSHTFVGNLFTAAGMVDIADRAGSSTDYPQLNAETLLSNNPDLIFLADTKCCGQSAATVSARPGYSTIAAVKNGRVVALDDDIASRWGPRVTDLLSKIVDADRSVPAS